MIKSERIELFLIVIEDFFQDNSGDINEKNCIGFYFYLLESFFFESRFTSVENLKFKTLLNYILSTLKSLPPGANTILNESPDKGLFLFEIAQIYQTAKSEYFI